MASCKFFSKLKKNSFFNFEKLFARCPYKAPWLIVWNLYQIYFLGANRIGGLFGSLLIGVFLESGCGNAMFSLFLVLILGGFFSLKLPRSPWDLTFFLFLSKKKLFSFAWLIQIKYVLIQISNRIEIRFQRVQISLIYYCLSLLYAYRKQYFFIQLHLAGLISEIFLLTVFSS